MNSIILKTVALTLISSLILTGCSKSNKEIKNKDVSKLTVAPTKAPNTVNVTKAYLDSLDGYKGAYYTKKYRNVFKELGFSQDTIDTKIQLIWDWMYNGSEDTSIYYESGKDEAYILDTGNQDVRSEGMSYGMMMCVQMNKQKEFDRLWKWAHTHMQVKNGENKGYFIWSMHPDGTPNANGPASDGEEYFAMSLFFASHRWGDREAPYDYSKQAKYILHQALHQEDDGIGSNMWNTRNKFIKFVPGLEFSDPSYHLPHFYELFALWADEKDRPFWKDASTASRNYLKLACNEKTGLAPEYATYDGVPESFNSGHDYFASDSFRVAGNIGLDYMWFAADPWEIKQSEKLQNFFKEQGLNNYISKYTVDGEPQEDANYQSLGLVAQNAMASLATTGADAKLFASTLWEKSPAEGQWRYYDNCLYFFSMLALSGKYRIW